MNMVLNSTIGSLSVYLYLSTILARVARRVRVVSLARWMVLCPDGCMSGKIVGKTHICNVLPYKWFY